MDTLMNESVDARTQYHQALTGAVLFDRSQRGLIQAQGPDAVRWLHNICTNDIVHMSGWCEAFLTTPKAKAVAHVYVYRPPSPEGSETLWITCEPGLSDKVLNYLDRYLISERVELSKRTGAIAQWHLAGPRAEAAHAQLTAGSQPASGMSSFRHDLLGLPGFDLFSAPDRAEIIRATLHAYGVHAAGSQSFEWLRVEAGLPLQGQDIDEDRFVVEVNRIPQTICYTKGCYLGQEPIVMARDRGHVNRKFMGLSVRGNEALPPGTRLFHEGNEVGLVTSSVVSPRFGPIALAYLRRGSDAPGTVLEAEWGGSRQAVQVTALPFGGGSGGRAS